MKITSRQLISLSLLMFGFAAGSIAYALDSGNPSQPPTLPPTPFPLSNRPTSLPPTFPQHPGSGDFLDHSIPTGFGMIKGKVIDDNTGAALGDAQVTIPELNISTKSDNDGNFAFDAIQVGTVPGAELDVTVEARAPGYGKHTMVNVGVFSQDTATVLLTLKRGSAPTRWFGLVPNKGQGKSAQAPVALANFSAPSGSLVSNPLPLSSMALGPLYPASATSPPPYIRVAIFPLKSDGSPSNTTAIRRDSVDFTFYMKHVLGSEWGPSWNTESLKAGAMAVKNYGWWYVIHPKYTYSDLDNSTNSQLYNPFISYASTDNAIDTMSSTGWYQNSSIFQSSYVAGVQNDPIGCYSNGVWTSDCMTQYGSKYWADQGKEYSWILNNYYGPSATGGGTLAYFSYAPKPPLTYVATSTPTTITLNYSSASSLNYVILKYNGTTWVQQYTGSLTSWQDTGLTNGTTYYYSVAASSPDGTWWSNGYPNGGYISAVAGWAPILSAPKTDAFFIATSTIRISATTTTPNIDFWSVDKYSATSGWGSIYDAMPPTATASTNKINSTNAFPAPAYLDMTKWEGSASGDRTFVYVDTGLTANTLHSYSIAYHTASGGWSAFSNNGGSVDPDTAVSN